MQISDGELLSDISHKQVIVEADLEEIPTTDKHMNQTNETPPDDEIILDDDIVLEYDDDDDKTKSRRLLCGVLITGIILACLITAGVGIFLLYRHKPEISDEEE